jgi:hypothetical protein
MPVLTPYQQWLRIRAVTWREWSANSIASGRTCQPGWQLRKYIATNV